MHLLALGWNSFFEDHWNSCPRQGLAPARIVEEQKQAYRLMTESGEWDAGVTGYFRHYAADSAGFPSVGDWVAAHVLEPEHKALIHEILPRRSKLSRNAAGSRVEEQVIVANVDVVMIVTSMNADLNPRRIERYLSTVWDSGAQPVLVLSKMDLCPDPSTVIDTMSLVAPGTNVHAISAQTSEGLEELNPYLGAGSTVALIGSSGVGKSTIINRLLESELQVTRGIREDGRGRHATTSRRLFPLPSGGVLIDTPGLRELQLWESGGLGGAFEEIEQLAKECRFRDCQHRTEPGCAVLQSVESGDLDSARVRSFHKLQRELEHLDYRKDPAAQSEKRKRWKQLTKAVRQNQKFKP